MLINLLAWAYITLLTGIYGWATLAGLGWALGRRGQGLSVWLSLWTIVLVGLAILGTIAAYLSLLVPLNLAVHGVLWLLPLGIAIARRSTLGSDLRVVGRQIKQGLGQGDRLYLFFAWGLILLLAFQSAVGPFDYDTGLYHAQAVSWAEQYPAVPGLGNFHPRLAFNSLWFTTTALFSFSQLLPHPLHGLNGWLVAIALLFALEAGITLRHQPARFSTLAQVLIAIPVIRLIYDPARKAVNVASQSADLAVSVLILVVMVLLLRYWEATAEALSDQFQSLSDRSMAPSSVDLGVLTGAIGLLSGFLLTLKLSALPVLLAVAVLLAQYSWTSYSKAGSASVHPWRKLVILGSLAGLPLGAYLARNVVLAGYWVFPVPSLVLSALDWHIPVAIAQIYQQVITAWARVPGADPAQVQAWGDWFPRWWRSVPNSFEFKALLAGILAALVIAGLRPRRLCALGQRAWLIFGTLILGIGFWFLTAPDLRFGYGFILGVAVFLILPLAQEGVEMLQRHERAFRLGSNAYVALCLVLALQNFNFYPSDVAFLIQPMPFPEVSVQAVQQGSVTLYRPENGDQCWLAAFPCAPALEANLELRGRSLRQGFRSREP